MRLLIINPNTSERVSRLILNAARHAVLEDTALRVVTAPFGSPALESVAETTIAAHAVLTALAQNWRSGDAVIIAAFSDPGLTAAREISPIPVFGMAESAMQAAAADGRAFSILTLGPHLEHYIRRQADAYGVEAQLVSIEFLDSTIDELSRNQTALVGAVTELSRAAVSKGADSVVLGGGPFSGLGQRVGQAIPVAVIDGIAAAVQQAEHSHARQCESCPPNATPAVSKEYQGLHSELITLLDHMAAARQFSTFRAR